jgi:GxxExxY protein
MASLIHQELSDKVLGAMFKVHNYLGPGLLESAYEGALAIELKNQGLRFDRQAVYPLYYAGECAGAYIADLVVENTIILELKSVKSLSPAMEAQLLNYLRLSSLPVGYLVNFRGTRLEWKRRVL